MSKACGILAVVLLFGPVLAAAQAHVHYKRAEGFDTPGSSGALAPLLANLGQHNFPVTTRSQRSQQFINQGLHLSYGFNHAEAGRAFAEAGRLDPKNAMAFWGQALVLGPNINAPMEPGDEPRARALIRKASALASGVSQRERDYIEALATRYTGKAADRVAADQAYAGAMRVLFEKHPDDPDAAALYAEAMMDLRPWDYWMRDGQPYAETTQIAAALERSLARDPNHIGALHFWIHLWEPSNTPQQAQGQADRLVGLAGAAGHLIHMPGHIYQRVGRYADAMRANERAIEADEDYIAQCRAQGLYPLGYYPHNLHFLWYAATMAGNSGVAISAAQRTAQAIPLDAFKDMPMLTAFELIPDFALVRFGKWDEILALGPPRLDSLYTRGVRHYARAMAFIRKKEFAAVTQEIAAVQQIAADPTLTATVTSWTFNNADAVLRLAATVLEGELAAARQDYETAIARLDRAVRLHDALIYAEPDDWHQPVRHVLGAVLLEAGKADEAETIYWEDLRRNPRNGWALFGLAQALRAQGKIEQAKAIEAQFKAAWAGADIALTGSRF